MIQKSMIAIKDRIDSLLDEHEPQIEAAIDANEGEIGFNVSVKIERKGNSNRVAVGIAYVEKRTKEMSEFLVSEEPELFEKPLSVAQV